MDALPWRLAAVAALAALVLGWATHVDLWIALARAGAVFVLFWLLGAFGRAIYTRSGVTPHPAPRARDRSHTHGAESAEDDPGANL